METDFLDDDLMKDGENELPTRTKGYIAEIAKWAKFMAIVNFVLVGLIILGGLFVLFNGAMGHEDGVVTLFVSLFLAILVFIPANYLFKFAQKTEVALISSKEYWLSNALESLKSNYKFHGILAIIYIVINILVVIFN